jgi:amino acid transporter
MQSRRRIRYAASGIIEVVNVFSTPTSLPGLLSSVFLHALCINGLAGSVQVNLFMGVALLSIVYAVAQGGWMSFVPLIFSGVVMCLSGDLSPASNP